MMRRPYKKPDEKKEALLNYLQTISGVILSICVLLCLFTGIFVLKAVLPKGFDLDKFVDGLIAAAGFFRGFVMMGTPIVIFAIIVGWFSIFLFIGSYLERALLFIVVRYHLRKLYSAEDIIKTYIEIETQQTGYKNIIPASVFNKYSWFQRLIDWEIRNAIKTIHAAYGDMVVPTP